MKNTLKVEGERSLATGVSYAEHTGDKVNAKDMEQTIWTKIQFQGPKSFKRSKLDLGYFICAPEEELKTLFQSVKAEIGMN